MTQCLCEPDSSVRQPPEKMPKHRTFHSDDFLINYANDTSSQPINVTLFVSAVLTQVGLQSVSTDPSHMGRLHRTAIRWEEPKEHKTRGRVTQKVFILKHTSCCHSSAKFYFATNQIRRLTNKGQRAVIKFLQFEFVL